MSGKKFSEVFSSELRPMLSASSIGIVFVVSILLGTLFGYWLDGKFDTKPYLTLVFMCFGIAAGVKNMIHFIRKAEALEKKGNEQSRDG